MKKTIIAMVLASVLVLTACTAGNGQKETAAGQQTSGSGSAEQSAASDSKRQDNTTAQTDSTNNSRQDQTGSEGNTAKDSTPSDAAAPAAYAGAAFELASEWLADQEYALASPAPANLEELKKTPEGAEVFKSAGNLLIKVERNETLEELEDKVETLKLRQQTMTRQEERVMKKLEEMQATIQQAMGGIQG